MAAVDSETIVKGLAEASNNDGVDAKKQGDPASAINGAAHKAAAVYQLPFLSHAPMEPINTTLHIRPDGADLWVGTQVPPRAQAAVAKAAGLQPEQVQVHNQYMGGAFGRRPRYRQHRTSGRHRQEPGLSGQTDLVARGGYPARPLPALLLRPPIGRAGRE